MKSLIRRHRSDSGFSLLEVLIAVVVLATGLLALAALQGSLTRNSADAKVRGRVAAMLTARMDELRSVGYGNPLLNVGTTTTASTTDGCDGDTTDWVDCTRVQSGLGSLSVTQVTAIWSSAKGASSFTEGRVPAAAGEPEFKRITLSATWTDAANDQHTLGTSSDASALSLSNDMIPPIDSNSSANKQPIVRQSSPVTPGMIPIAIGGGSDTAATNPKPIIVGSNSAVAETAFNVLTYHNDSSTVVKVQQRVETRVVACSCKLSSNPSFTTMMSKNFRPTYWDGTRYRTPDMVGIGNVASYAAPAMPNPAATSQSDVCTQCCRDHHDPTSLNYNGPDSQANTVDDLAKFDPMRTSHGHYVASNSVATATAVTADNAIYNEACRVIRVDGLWRVAADANEEQFGLVRTENDYVGKNPDTLYADYYEEFVKDYLQLRFVTQPNATTDPIALFNDSAYHMNDAVVNSNANLNPPPLRYVPVKASGQIGDAKYLHGRGLYVDHIEPEAAKAIRDSITACIGTTDEEKRDCALPHVPFTTINLTQLANFATDSTASPDVLNVQNSVTTRGQINGISGAANNATEGALVAARRSNTGLTGSLPIDPDDVSVMSDIQPFVISNNTSTTGAPFIVNLTPFESPLMSDGVAVNDPVVNWQIGSSGLGCRPTADAQSPNPYTCRTDSTLGVAADVIVSNYNYAEQDSPAVTCPNADPNGTIQTVSVSPTPRPVCKRFRVNAASGTLGAVLSSWSVSANADKYTEATTVQFSTLPANSVISIGFEPLSDLPGTVQQCNFLQNPDNSYYVSSVVWTDPCN